MITAATAALDAQRERLAEFVDRFDRADDVDRDEQVDLVLELLARAATKRQAAAA